MSLCTYFFAKYHLAAYAEELFNFPDVWDFVLDGEPTLKDRVIAFFKGSPKRYSFAPEMDPAARAWLREYKKLFDQVVQLNAGNNVATNVGADKRVIRRLGKMVDGNSEFEMRNSELDNSPKTIKKLGKIVENAQKTPLTNINQEDVNVSGRSAINNSNLYDFKKPFYHQIEDYKNGVFPKTDSLIIGQTPEVFLNIGLNPLPMTINQRHVDYVINGTKNADHEIGEVVLKYLPTALKNPVAIISSATANSTSLVAIISITHNGHQIIAPVYIDGAGRQNGIVIDCNAIASVHSRKNSISKLLADALADEVNGKNGVYYWDKKRALALLSGEKVTMPNSLNTLSDGSIHSIHEKGSPVKPKLKNVTESQQFKRWFGDWQNHPDRASKVVNDDGTPKILYHQTGEDFTVFDPRHKGSGSNDNGTPFGIFMKPQDNDIGLNGKKQMALYARIANPLVVNNREHLECELKKMSPRYAKLIQQEKALAAEYQKKLEDAGKAWSQYAKEYRDAHPEATRSEIYNDKKFSELYDAEDILTEEWITKANEISKAAKEEITRVLEEND